MLELVVLASLAVPMALAAPPASGPASVMARISEITAKFEPSTSSSSSSSSTDATFESVLSSLLGTSTTDSSASSGGVTGEQIVDSSMQCLSILYGYALLSKGDHCRCIWRASIHSQLQHPSRIEDAHIPDWDNSHPRTFRRFPVLVRSRAFLILAVTNALFAEAS